MLQNKMLMMRVNGLNSESIMVLYRDICNARVKDAIINNKKIFHVVGKAIRQVCLVFFSKWTTYESYIDKGLNPLKYVRKINEGGYVKTKSFFLSIRIIVFC
jgi:hypothetical protein